MKFICYLIEIYNYISIKEIKFIQEGKNYNWHVFLHHIKEIEKLEAHNRMNKSDCVLFFIIFFSKYLLKSCNKFHFLWKLLSKRGQENLYHFVAGKEAKLCKHLILRRQLNLNLIV